MCFFFFRKRRQDSFPRRQNSFPRRMSTFRGSAKRPLAALRRMVNMTTLVAPAQGGFPRAGSAANGADNVRPYPVITPGILKHLRRIYNDLCGWDRGLSREKLVDFLKGVQGEATLLPLEKDTFTFEQFLEAWYMQYGWEAEAPRKAEEKDVTHPISNYFINSSHNTYLDGDQFFSDSRPDMYKRVLSENCRCIEIDVWNGETSGTRTPNRSRSPHPERLHDHPPEHHRHLSTASFITASTAAETIEKVEETIHTVKEFIRGRGHHNHRHRQHSPNSSQPTLPEAESSSAISLDARDSDERVGRSRESTKLSKFVCPKNEPRVLHGWTGTKPTGFREVCKAIRETAFVHNSLPIIVSLEVHADLEQQEVMVDIMKEEWGNLLLEMPHDGCDPKHRQPRLDELQNKILIKVKRQAHKAAAPTDAAAGGANGNGAPALLTPAVTLEDDAASLSEDERAAPQQKKTKKVPICESLSALAVYTHSEHFHSFDAPAARTPSHIFSISEKRIMELHATKRHEMFQHNRDFFMRAFPAGWRFDSSNLEPSLYWRKGVQMVAMNWQSCDEGMMLNHAMFADSQGWVRKPPGYRSGDALPDAVPLRSFQLTIRVLAAQHVPLPPARHEQGVGVGTGGSKSFHPIVMVKVHVERQEAEHPGGANGEAATTAAAAAPKDDHFKQKTKPSETDHPDFGRDGTEMRFPEVSQVVEELSFVRFKIEDSSSYFHGHLAAWACIRMDRLRSGYRFIDLRDHKGKPSEGKLLVHVTKTVR